MPELTASEWDVFLAQQPDAHLLQTSAWGRLKSEFGWQSAYLAAGAAGAQVLFRRLPLGLKLAYIPRGPVISGNPEEAARAWTDLLPEMDALCRRRGAFMLKIEPDIWEQPGAPGETPPGFRPAVQEIQPPRTLLIDLAGDEAQLLGRMKQKTRYNIRLAQKKGVQVQPASDLETFHHLMLVTGQRDAFGVHSLAYYRRAYELFRVQDQCALLVASCAGEPLAAIMVFARGQRAWYFYGASSDAHRELMPTYLVQWEGLRWARERGCRSYDLWGVPDADEAALEANFTKRSDGLWGVYRFKRGFGGVLCRAQGPWDRVYRPLWYAFYRWWTARQAARERADGAAN
jgi:lipid II:glycine glycyltransferase (peptidoglycan interpeptide bridge formation enzyme)